MGIVRQQSIRSSIYIYIGFFIGAFNVLVLYTHVLTAEQYGLMQLLLNACVVLSILATLGSVPVINKFFPFYNEYLKSEKNDLPFLAIGICLFGFLLFIIASIVFKGFIIRKFGGNSPLFIRYYYLIYPLTFFLLVFTLLESFAWGLRKTVLTNFLRETSVKLYGTILVALFAMGLFVFDGFIKIYSFLYAIPCIVLLGYLARSGRFRIHASVSSVTRRLSKRMASFSAYVFGSNIFNLLSRTMEVFFISSISGLGDTGRYAIGDFVSRFLEVPQRSIAAITVPLLASHWKNKEYSQIQELYTKSSAALLISGLLIFGMIWLNVDNFILFLPGQFGSPHVKYVILILGIGKLIDLGTGINTQIIQTSNFWKFDFYTNIFYTLISIPLNYFLIHRYGMTGAAYTASLALTLFNVIRFVFIWWKFGLQPFTFKTLLSLVFALSAYLIVHLLPFMVNIYIDTIVRTGLFVSLFLAAVLRGNLSDDISQLWDKWSVKLLGRNFFRHK